MLKLEDLKIAVATLAYQEVELLHAKESNANKAVLYPNLSQTLKGLKAAKPKPPKWFNQKLKASLTEIIKTETVVTNGKKNNFSDYWQGIAMPIKVNTDLTPTQRYEQLLYQQGAKFGLNGGISKESFSVIFPEIDLNTSTEWCVSLDGKNVISADDYYSGNYAEFKTAHDEAISSASDEQHKRKLIAQFNAAQERLLKADVSTLEFSINSTIFSLQDKCHFLNQYFAQFNGKFRLSSTDSGKDKIEFVAKAGKYTPQHDKDRINALKRLALYASNQTSFTSGKKGEDDKRIRQEMKTYLRLMNAQFTSWIQADSVKMADVEARVNNIEGLTFKEMENGDDIQISGIKESFKPRSHQAAFVRQQARNMGGILGFDVGLGKTFSALLAVQHLQSINVKNKTIFIVPSSTFTNWKKECEAIYTDEVMAQCLFVGLSVDKNGEATYKSANVVADLAKITENKHSKLFMTYEGFKAISLGNQTIEDYLTHLAQVDEQMALTDSNKLNEKIKSDAQKLKANLIKDMKGKLLESMGVDSLVIDEAHNFKNGKKADFGNRVRYLSVSNEPSNRALDMLIKSWYIRNENKKNSGKSDGVLALTATPITNSPLEIYSMLSLAVGEERVNKLCGVNSPEQFLEMFCLIDTKEERSIDDMDIEMECFTGLRNIDALRKLMNSVATMKTADDLPDKQGYAIPDEETISTTIPLVKETQAQLLELKEMYQMAKLYTDSNTLPSWSKKGIAKMLNYAEKIGLTPETLAHPFNFISRQTKAIIDKDMADETSRYFFKKKQSDIAQKVVDEFNKKPLVDKARTNLIGVTDEPYVLNLKESKKNSESTEMLESKEVYDVTVLAKLDSKENLISLNSVSYAAQSKLLSIAEKLGLALDVTLSPKLSALIDNVKAELVNGQAKGGIAKQIIFTEELGMHQKIKQALIAKCDIPSGKIAIINAVAIPDNADLQEVQDGFNADNDGENQNKYQIVIANKKAEVGINLQKGTQAIHHLDINWTPDSIQQRNGRGIRQGNYLALQGIKVRVYHYETKGTFDSYKRSVVDKKADWIGELLHGDSNRILASQESLSVQQQAELALLIGDEEAMANKMAEFVEENRQKALKSLREDVILSHRQLKIAESALDNLTDFESYLTPLFNAYVGELREYGIGLSKLNLTKTQINEETAKLNGDEKGSATYDKRLKNIESLQEKLDRAKERVSKQWGVVVFKYGSLDNRLNVADVPYDSDSLAPYYDIQGVKEDVVKLADEHPLFERYENEKAVKQQLRDRYQQNINVKLDESGLTMERLKYGEANFILNSFPLLTGDLLKEENRYYVIDNAEKSRWNKEVYCFAVNDKNGDFLAYGDRAHRYISERELESFELIPKNSLTAQNIYAKLAETDKGKVANQRWKELIPEVSAFYDENEMVKLVQSGGFDKVKLGYVLRADDLMALVESMPEMAQEIIKDYAENGIVFENGQLFAKANLDFSTLGARSGSAVSRYALKYGYRINDNYWVYTSYDYPSFFNLECMSYFEMPDYDVSPYIAQMKEVLDKSTNKSTDLRQVCKQALIDFGIGNDKVVDRIVRCFSGYPKSEQIHYQNLFVKLNTLYYEALNNENAFATETGVSNETNKTKTTESPLPNFLVVTGDTSSSGYDGLRNKVKEALVNANITHLDGTTAVFWCVERNIESFKSTNMKFFRENGGAEFKTLVKQHVPRNSWLIHQEAWTALLNFDRENLNEYGISVRAV